MSRSLLVRPEAEADLVEAFDWYEECSRGLGSEFLLAVDAVLECVIRNPEQYTVVHKEIRRALLRRFPYGVFFLTEPDRVIVLAVFHASRNPARWRERAP